MLSRAKTQFPEFMHGMVVTADMPLDYSPRGIRPRNPFWYWHTGRHWVVKDALMVNFAIDKTARNASFAAGRPTSGRGNIWACAAIAALNFGSRLDVVATPLLIGSR